MTLLQDIFDVVWLILPAGVANIMPVIAARYSWMPSLMRPIDGGAYFRDKRLLGDNKTIQGFVVGILFGSIMSYVQYLFYKASIVPPTSLFTYSSADFALMFGALLGAGALLGDATKSFLKRQFDIAPGKPWHPWDQIDATLGALVVASFFIPLSLKHFVIGMLLFSLITWIVSFVGVALRIKKTI